MMPVDWPLADASADRLSSPARPRAGGRRLATARADFFLDESLRLTDEERSLMAAMLRGLVVEICDELIAALPPSVAARSEAGRDLAYRRLRQAGLLDRPQLVASLLRRADEQQLAGRADGVSDGMASALVADANPAVAEAAMALTVARGRRRDRFGRLGLEFDDLAAEEAVAMVQATAAILRESLDDEDDPALGKAAQALLARHDEGRRLDAAVAGLSRALQVDGRAGDESIRRLALEGDASLLVGLLSRRASIDGLDGWALFTGGDAMLLARMAGCERATAAQILASFETLLGGSAPDRAIDRFDRIDDATVERCRRWLRLDPDYRAARETIEAANG